MKSIARLCAYIEIRLLSRLFEPKYRVAPMHLDSKFCKQGTEMMSFKLVCEMKLACVFYGRFMHMSAPGSDFKYNETRLYFVSTQSLI